MGGREMAGGGEDEQRELGGGGGLCTDKFTTRYMRISNYFFGRKGYLNGIFQFVNISSKFSWPIDISHNLYLSSKLIKRDIDTPPIVCHILFF